MSLKDPNLLGEFCCRFNPYQTPFLSGDLLFLQQWGLDHLQDDPYALTRELLLLQERYLIGKESDTYRPSSY